MLPADILIKSSMLIPVMHFTPEERCTLATLLITHIAMNPRRNIRIHTGPLDLLCLALPHIRTFAVMTSTQRNNLCVEPIRGSVMFRSNQPI